jgi:hypothetical protein
LLDALAACVARADFDAQRVAQAALAMAADFVGEGGREEQGLAFLGQGGEQGVEFVGEAEVEHAVGLVEHQGLAPA